MKVIVFGKMRFRRREKITKKTNTSIADRKTVIVQKELKGLSGKAIVFAKANPIDHETESNTTTKKRVECRSWITQMLKKIWVKSNRNSLI